MRMRLTSDYGTFNWRCLEMQKNLVKAYSWKADIVCGSGKYFQIEEIYLLNIKSTFSLARISRASRGIAQELAKWLLVSLIPM